MIFHLSEYFDVADEFAQEAYNGTQVPSLAAPAQLMHIAD